MAPHPSSPVSRSLSRITAFGRSVLIIVAVAVAVSGCGGRSAGPTFERATTPPGLTVPADFPTGFVVPDGWILVDAGEARVEADYGASASWQADSGYDDTVETVETILTSLGWPITRRIDDSIEGTDEKSLVLYMDGSPMLRVRFNDNAALDGVLVTAELPV